MKLAEADRVSTDVRWREGDMLNSSWEAIFKSIPPELQNQYILVTASGTELAIQSLLRIEAEFVIIKGRLSGSQEQGRVFFLPFEHVDWLGTAAAIKDTDFNEVFGSLRIPTPDRRPAPAEPTAEPSPPPAEQPTVVQVPAGKSGSGQRQAIRSEVLERFRNNRPNAPASSPSLPNPKGGQP